MIQLNMIIENKAAHAPHMLVCCYVSHGTQSHTIFIPGPLTLPSSMVVCVAICPDCWLSSQNQHVS